MYVYSAYRSLASTVPNGRLSSIRSEAMRRATQVALAVAALSVVLPVLMPGTTLVTDLRGKIVLITGGSRGIGANPFYASYLWHSLMCTWQRSLVPHSFRAEITSYVDFTPH